MARTVLKPYRTGESGAVGFRPGVPGKAAWHPDVDLSRVEEHVDTRLRISGHPIQPVLMTFPVGLFVCAVVFDVGRLVGAPTIVGEVGYWTAVAGLVATALTMVAGLIDLWDVPAGA